MNDNYTKVVAASDEVGRKLDKLADGIQNRVLGRAMNRALTPFVRAVKSFTPVRSGISKKAVTKKVKKYPGGTVYGLVGVSAAAVGEYKGKRVRPNLIWHLIQGGTKKHAQPKRRVIHPGAKPHPIIVPARAAVGDAPVKIFEQETAAELNKLQQKAGV